MWHAPLLKAADQEVVYRDLRRFTYREFRARVGRLASALAGMGVRPGDTVGVLDWDSNRFLEAFFAVPTMGAVLQTVNVRLPPEQIAYTINHAGSSVLLVNDFVPVLQDLMPQLPNVTRLVAMLDGSQPRMGGRSFEGEYEGCWLLPRRIIVFRTSTKIPKQRRFTRAAQRACLRGSIVVTGRWSFTACPS